MAKERSDADRRARQCAKFARLIRIARLVLGNGRWGPEALAREIECSERTIFRDVETLTLAGIPIFFDKSVQAYRVPPTTYSAPPGACSKTPRRSSCDSGPFATNSKLPDAKPDAWWQKISRVSFVPFSKFSKLTPR
jgi:biotin operon repressor